MRPSAISSIGSSKELRAPKGSAVDEEVGPAEPGGGCVRPLDQALDVLDGDREFLTAGGVFTDDMIDGYIQLKMDEVTRMRMTTHPVEFDMYYSL